MLTHIDSKYIEASIDWEAYLHITDSLLALGKTTGPNQSKAMVDYTRLNMQRTRRWMKQYQPSKALLGRVSAMPPAIWLVLTEPWCGDAAHNIPPMVKMALFHPTIQLRFLFRDEHSELMDHFMTDGGRSVPKLIVLHPDTLKIIGTWGPRPASFQKMVMDYKAQPSMPAMDFYESLHARYNKDKQEELEKEFMANLDVWVNVLKDSPAMNYS
jgi:hypothetical protein